MTPKRFDLYGSRGLSLDEATAAVGDAIGLQMRLHDSDYIGGEYFRGTTPSGTEIKVQPNYEDGEGYLTEPDFATYRLLVYVSYPTPDVTEALRAVSSLELLRSTLH